MTSLVFIFPFFPECFSTGIIKTGKNNTEISGLNKQKEILVLNQKNLLFGILELKIYIKQENKKRQKNMFSFGNIRNWNIQKEKKKENCYTENLALLQYRLLHSNFWK